MKLKLITASLMGLSLSTAAWAVEPFTINDIRIEGLQRTEPATVFTYMPVKIGEKFNDEKAEETIRNLYQTGFFDDVMVESTNNQVVVTVIERPIISSLTVTGGKDISNDILRKNMDRFGLGQSKPFNPTLLNQAMVALKGEYDNRGKYNAKITPKIDKLDRNRIALSIQIEEGDTTKITTINFEGNKAYSTSKLRKTIDVTGSGLFTWYTKSNRFGEEKMAESLEVLRDFYHNNGYFDFQVADTQVVPEKDNAEKLVVNIKVNEGTRYKWGDIKIIGNTEEVPMAELQKLVKIKPGKWYNRSQMLSLMKMIQNRMGISGYAFSNVNIRPEPNQQTGVVDFTLAVDAGKKIFINQINISGNNKSRDEVIRRELRQMESAVYNQQDIDRSKVRIQQLGYFDDVKVDVAPVEGAPDQVDIGLNVVERNTGSVDVSMGYVQDDGIVFSGGIAQDNLFGTGKSASLRLSHSKSSKVAALSFTDPYFTPDGVSLGYDVYGRMYDPNKIDVSRYKTTTYGTGLRMGVPITEYDRVNFGLGVEHLNVGLYNDSPERYVKFVKKNGKSNWTFKGNVGWGRNTTDSAIWPTRGYIINANLDAGLPGGDIEYVKLQHQQTWFFPLSNDFTLMLNGELGWAKGYGKTKELPFFHNFYGGGLGSVRGFESSSLGPKEIVKGNSDPDYLGGSKMAAFNAELLFPMPGMRNNRAVRLSTFVDAGSVWDDKSHKIIVNDKNTKGRYKSTMSEEFRYSAGVALTWLSPMGPLKFSYAYPLNKKKEDKLQRFQFQLGTTF